MSITPSTLARSAGLSAVVAGLLFIGIQINHPHLDATFATSAEYTVRQSVKIVMAVLSLIGITGMYLPHAKRMGVLGLIGYLVFGAGYLVMMSVEVIGAVVIPTLATRAPDYVNDVFAVAMGGHAAGDIGALASLNAAMGLAYIGGGVMFGVALLRAKVLARWAAVVLAVGTGATLAIPLLPMINERLFAVPTGVALIGLGYSLWRRTPAAGSWPKASAGLSSGQISSGRISSERTTAQTRLP